MPTHIYTLIDIMKRKEKRKKEKEKTRLEKKNNSGGSKGITRKPQK